MSTNSTKLRAYEEITLRQRNEIILEHLPQIKYIAQKIARRLPKDVQIDDLISAGVIGLVDAYEKFDQKRGVQFKTYAEVRIRGAILDSLRKLDWAPRSLRKRNKELEQVYADLEQELGRPATDEEAASRVGVTLPEFHTLLDQLNGLTIGHFHQVDDGTGGFDEDSLPLRYSTISHEEGPFEIVKKGEMRKILAQIIETLPEREQLVVSLYYFEELTMSEIGEILGVNESRISQLHTRTILRLRGKLKNALKLRAEGRP